jgi:hypothetical protein
MRPPTLHSECQSIIGHAGGHLGDYPSVGLSGVAATIQQRLQHFKKI